MAVSAKPTNTEYRTQLADMLYIVGDFDGAKAEALKTIQLDTLQVNAYFTLAQIFEKTGDTLQALSQYHAYLKKDSMSSKAEIARQRLSLLNR